MTLTSPSWCCQRCGTAFISNPPEHRLCRPCREDLEALTLALNPDAESCPTCGGPVCPDCGQATATVIPVPVPAAPPVLPEVEQTVQQAAGYHRHAPGGRDRR